MKIGLLAIILLLGTSLGGKSFALNRNIHDCSILTMKDGKYALVEKSKSVYDGIMPKEAVNKAFDNLRAACCNNILWNDCEGIDVNATYPDSIILFDHLLDVYLRRLDAKQGDENGGDLIYGLEPDPVGKEWRDFISEIGNSTDGNPPVAVDTFFQEKRALVVNMEKYSSRSVQLNSSSWARNVEAETKNYDEWTLMDRYYNACNVVMMMYLKIADPLNNRSQISSQQGVLKGFYEGCENLVSDRINDERDYAEAVMQQQGLVFLNNALNSYLNVYFLENKLAHLEETIYKRGNKFKEVVKGIDKLVKNCS